MKREREEEIGGAAMSPSPSTASAARVLGRAMEWPSGFHSLRAPSPFVRAMRTRLDPPPPIPAAPPPPPLQLQIPEKRRRGRPRYCDRLLPPPGFPLSPPARAPAALAAHGQCQLGGLQPHVLNIDVGEDIVSRIVEVSQINGKVVCVLSVLGAVQDANLLHSSSAILNHKGPLEIIRAFGSILTSDAPGFGCLSVTLACADCSVVGGIIAGPLIAATPVQAIVGSFFNDAFRPNTTPKIIACYPNSHVAIGNGITPLPNSQVYIGTGSTHYPNFLVAVDSGSTHYPCSQVTLGNGSTNNANSQVTVYDESTNNTNSQVTVSIGSARCPKSQVTVGDGSSHQPSSKDNGSTPSIEGSNPEFASCTAVEQDGSSEIDVKPSRVVA
ncbi:AT-hook motif nuclear-localized protein 2-like isoform X1 [Phragmites australis]|uniref:AT-hook motif nuclear-localized protein 2-like isoform X1 n=1 Tax=Phragmites australis TaxID=29695 RepID=UPI002D79F518|nr:AT-hook motif nuclear-localized protein 2-like isoform X1 [Phragmites australis]